MMETNRYDVIVIGSGIAGLSFANYFLEQQQVLSTDQRKTLMVVSKGAPNDTNTSWAQGGIAAAIDPEDSILLHIQDTLNAGAHANNLEVTAKILAQAPEAINDLITWGAEFDRTAKGDFDLGLEGGHSYPRILHHKDATGANLQQALVQQYNKLGGSIHSHLVAVHVEKTEAGFVVLFYDSKQDDFKQYSCVYLVLATGGLGQLYEHTTNTQFSNGDGLVLAHHLSAVITDLAMIQFHPTGLYTTDGKDFLITEALRGAGAVLLNHDQQPFMKQYDSRGDLAPRDIVARAIWNEMHLANQPHVWLDATSIPADMFNHHFSTIVENCKNRIGIDPAKQWIPVVPMQHYSCGGILTNAFGESTVPGLFALGECASTGLHGANRLASNSLLEGICMARFASNHINTLSFDTKDKAISTSIQLPSVYDIDSATVKSVVSKAAGVTRKKSAMLAAMASLQETNAIKTKIEFSLNAFQNTVLLELAIMLLEDALQKEESIGVHYVTA